MKALFSLRPPSGAVNSSAGESNNHNGTRDANKRERTMSTGSLFDKNKSIASTSSSLYAQPQDILYPSHAKYNNGTHGKDLANDLWNNGKKSRPPLDPFRKADVGDAPKSPPTVEPSLSKRSSKMLFNSFRGRKPGTSTESSKASGFDLRNRNHQPAPSSTRNGQDKEVPFVVVGSRSLSTPAIPGRTKAREKELPPDLPSRNISNDDKSSDRPLRVSSTQTQANHHSGRRSDGISVKASGAQDELTPTQATIPTFPGPSPINLHFLQAPCEKRLSKSAPTTPRLDQGNHSPSGSMFTPRQGDTFTLKRAFTKKSSKKIDVRKAEENSEVGSSISQASSPSQFMNSRPVPTSHGSQDLASELNELAVAHKEGLLGEEEYRMLRQSVFDKLSGRGDMEVPREGRLGVSLGRNGDVARDVDNSLVSPTPSLRSRSSSTSKLASLFRKGLSAHGQSYAGSSSLLSGEASIFNGRSPSTRSNQNTLESQTMQARRARYIQSGGERPSSPTYGYIGASNASRAGTSLYSPSAMSAAGVSISSGNTLLGANYMDKNSDEIQAEIAIVEAEGKRILEGFKSLQMNAMGRYNLNFASMRRALQGIGLETDSDGSFFDDYIIVDGKNSQGKYTHSNGSGDLLSGLIRKTRSFSTKDVASNSNDRRARKKGDSRLPPSSYKNPANHSVPVSPNTPPSSLSVASMEIDEEESASVVELRTQLKEIVRRRNEVSQKYTDRIAFLRSTLRSAKIREGLK